MKDQTITFEQIRAAVKAHYGVENVFPALRLIRMFLEIPAKSAK